MHHLHRARLGRLPPKVTRSPPPLTPREEAIVAPQRPRGAIPGQGQGAALPPAGIDPTVRAMDESLLGTVFAKRPGRYGF